MGRIIQILSITLMSVGLSMAQDADPRDADSYPASSSSTVAPSANQADRTVRLSELLNPSVEVLGKLTANEREEMFRSAWQSEFAEALSGHFESYLVTHGVAVVDARRTAQDAVNGIVDCTIQTISEELSFEQLTMDDVVGIMEPCLVDVAQQNGLLGLVRAE